MFSGVERVTFTENRCQIGPDSAVAPGVGLQKDERQSGMRSQSSDLLACRTGLSLWGQHPQALELLLPFLQRWAWWVIDPGQVIA